MPGKYAKAELLGEAVFRRKAEGGTNKGIPQSYGLSKTQIKDWSNARFTNPD